GEVAEDHDGAGAVHRVGGDVRAGRPMSGDRPTSQRLEQAIGAGLRAGVTASSVCLAVGVLWSLVTGESGVARILLQTGILVLLMTPVARVVVSIAQYVSD